MAKFQVGYASVNINPPLGIAIGGYYIPRNASGFLDDLEIGALVLKMGRKSIALISVDHCGIPKSINDDYVELVHKKTGLPKTSIFIAATHSHTAPKIEKFEEGKNEDSMLARYGRFIGERMVDAVLLAIADLKNAKMGYIVGYAPERVAYIRRYKMKDGSVMTCPPINDPNIDYPLGTLDQRVNVLRFDREGGETVVLVNYGLHSDTINGDLISSDWPGWMRKTLDKALDGVKCIFFNGAEGDVGSTKVNVKPEDGDMNDTEISFDNEMKSPGMARFVGRAIAGTVLQVYDKVQYVDVDSIDIISKKVEIAANVPAKEDLPRAHEYKELHEAGRDDLIPYTAMELTTVVAEAIRMCNLENGPEFFDLYLTGVKIGPVAMIGIPGEPFTDIGVGIKDTEGWDLIMPCALTNGSMGYFPMQSAYDEGGYEVRSSRYKAGVAETLIAGGKELLGELKK